MSKMQTANFKVVKEFHDLFIGIVKINKIW